MLKSVLWPAVKGVATRRRLWFQQDGATVHTTVRAREWLEQKIGARVISRLTEHPWPTLDYWFWNVAMAEVRRAPPATLDDLKLNVEAFSKSLDKEEVIRSVKHMRERAHTFKVQLLRQSSTNLERSLIMKNK